MEVDQLLTTAETAQMLHTPVATLRWWRHQGTGPKAFRLGARKVMYRRSDVLAWLEQQYAADGDPAA
jgi:predicted DNA-binding transcriptional regulator AlpA